MADHAQSKSISATVWWKQLKYPPSTGLVSCKLKPYSLIKRRDDALSILSPWSEKLRLSGTHQPAGGKPGSVEAAPTAR